MPATWIGGTIGNPNAYGVNTNWSGGVVPPSGDTITFSGSINCDLGGANRTVAGVTFSGYTGTLALTGNLIVNGNVAFQAGAMNVSGTNALVIGGNSTITPNGGNWLGNLQIGNATSIVVTLASGFSVSGTLTFSATVSLTGTFFITALGDVVASTNCIVSTTNANSTTLVLAGSTTKWSGNGRLGCNITFNSPSSNFIIENDVVFGSVVVGSASPQLNFTSGASTTTTGSTLTFVGSVQLSVQQIVFNNVNFGTLGLNQLFTVSLIQDLVIGGNLVVGFGGSGQHQVSRSSTQKIFVRGNLQVGISNISNNSISGQGANGGEIMMQGNATSTSTMSSYFNGVAGSQKCWCNMDITIDAGANNIALDTTNDFNFGNPVASALNPRRFKYTSGNFSAAGSTINLANSILDLGAAQLNNVRIYAFGALAVTTNVQLQSNTTITGNLITGGFNSGASTSAISQSSGSTATTLTIQGGMLLGTTVFANRNSNPLNSATISLNFVGSGTIEGNSMCNATTNLNSGNYTINDFFFGNYSLSPATIPTFKYNGGSITCTGTLYTSNAKLDLSTVQLQNLTPTVAGSTSGGGGVFTLTIIASSILRVNGNFTTGVSWNPLGSGSGVTTLNADITTLSAQIDVYGSVNMSSNLAANTFTSGTCRIYMKGTGTLTTNGIAYCGIDVFLQGTVTLGNFWIGNGKRLEFISGSVITTPTSLTTISNSSFATIKTLGQTWGDIGIRGGSFLVADGNITCRDLITYNDSFNVGIQGVGFIVTIKRNLTIGAQPLLAGNLSGVNPIDKLVMDATDGGTGTWTSGTGQLRISLDLNAPTRTIVVSGTVNFGSQTTQRLRWFATTTMNTTGSTLTTGSATLDLGNQVWGGLTTGTNASVHFESDATFTNVNLTGGGSSMSLNGVTTARNLTVQGNLAISQNTGTNTGFNLVDIIFNGNGTWSNGVGFTLNENIILASGTRTLSGIVNWGGSGIYGIGGAKTFSATGGTLAGGTSTFNILGSNTITIDKFTRGTFNNVTTSANSTITLNAQMGITGTLTLNSLAANITTFASSSTFGWDAVNFTHGGGNSTCILNAGSTYNISGTFTMLGGNAASRATLRSSKLSTFANATANGILLTSSGVGGSPVEVGMALSQASVVASDGFAAIYPNRPILTSAGVSPFSLNPSFPVTPSTGPVNMEAGIKANLNLAVSTGVPLILFATVKDINSIGGQTIYAFQTYLDAPSNPQADMFRTINWNTLAPPVSPIGIGFLSIT
jgi:fibronectin-binding autotransporter adhesin